MFCVGNAYEIFSSRLIDLFSLYFHCRTFVMFFPLLFRFVYIYTICFICKYVCSCKIFIHRFLNDLINGSLSHLKYPNNGDYIIKKCWIFKDRLIKIRLKRIEHYEEEMFCMSLQYGSWCIESREWRLSSYENLYFIQIFSIN